MFATLVVRRSANVFKSQTTQMRMNESSQESEWKTFEWNGIMKDILYKQQGMKEEGSKKNTRQARVQTYFHFTLGALICLISRIQQYESNSSGNATEKNASCAYQKAFQWN